MVILDEGEEIVHVVRRHWFVMVLTTLGALMIAVLPWVLYLILHILHLIPALAVHVKEALLFFYVIFIIFVWMFYFLEWTDYYLDTWVITNKRVINIEQKGLFRREMISLHYNRVQDVTVTTEGVIRTLLDFGRIHLQTAGEVSHIILKDAPHPEEVKKIIMQEAQHRHGHT